MDHSVFEYKPNNSKNTGMDRENQVKKKEVNLIFIKRLQI